MYPRQVLIVEDEALLRDLLAQTLNARGFDVHTAANASQARTVFDDADIDAIIVDINLGPGLDGFDLAEALLRDNQGLGIVFLTNLPDARFTGHQTREVFRGAAYLRKAQLLDSNELVDALEAVLGGRVNNNLRHDKDPARPLAQLSRMQLEVLKMVAQGMSNQQIADERGRSVGSVESMLTRIFTVLGIDASTDRNARVEAARAYMAAAGIPALVDHQG